MGADLIGYFGKGPKELPQSAIPAAEAEAERRIEWLRRASKALDTTEPRALFELILDCPWSQPEQAPPAFEDVDFEVLRSDIENLVAAVGDVENLTGEQAVNQFVESWPPQFRDAAYIIDPDTSDKLIVFAGDKSWGDMPDGAGFRMLALAGILGVAQAFGVWVEAAFLTIRIPRISKGN